MVNAQKLVIGGVMFGIGALVGIYQFYQYKELSDRDYVESTCEVKSAQIDVVGWCLNSKCTTKRAAFIPRFNVKITKPDGTISNKVACVNEISNGQGKVRCWCTSQNGDTGTCFTQAEGLKQVEAFMPCNNTATGVNCTSCLAGTGNAAGKTYNAVGIGRSCKSNYATGANTKVTKCWAGPGVAAQAFFVKQTNSGSKTVRIVIAVCGFIIALVGAGLLCHAFTDKENTDG